MKKSKAIELLAKGEIQIYVDVKKTKLLKTILEKAFPKYEDFNDFDKNFFDEIISKKPFIQRDLNKQNRCVFIVEKIDNPKIVKLSEIKKEKQDAPISAKIMAKNLIDGFRINLMVEDTECGNEILCTEIAKKIAIKTAYNMIQESKLTKSYFRAIYWKLVIKKINEYVH